MCWTWRKKPWDAVGQWPVTNSFLLSLLLSFPLFPGTAQYSGTDVRSFQDERIRQVSSNAVTTCIYTLSALLSVYSYQQDFYWKLRNKDKKYSRRGQADLWANDQSFFFRNSLAVIPTSLCLFYFTQYNSVFQLPTEDDDGIWTHWDRRSGCSIP